MEIKLAIETVEQRLSSGARRDRLSVRRVSYRSAGDCGYDHPTFDGASILMVDLVRPWADGVLTVASATVAIRDGVVLSCSMPYWA